jgi:hypothetical protein
MSRAQHYCARCESHFGGPPNNVTPEEHQRIEHDGKPFDGERDGTAQDYHRKQTFKVDEPLS